MKDWVSAETERKEEDFRGVLVMHATICRGILLRQPAALPYLYVDLYAGRGHLEYQGRRFDGSPLIARDVLTGAGFPFEAVHYESDPQEAELLTGALAGRTSTLFDSARDDATHIEECQAGFARWLDDCGPQPERYGLVYSDPIRDEIPHDLLNHAAKNLPRVDLLSYVSATQYKRRRGCDPGRPFLADHILAVDKRHALIREPIGMWQWTFVLWSNWGNLPQWQKRGFYKLHSEKGLNILEQLNLSEKERHAKANTPLPGMGWETA